ncbi:MAG: polyphosphate kinase 1 [Erysipelotrichaceae bacterium]
MPSIYENRELSWLKFNHRVLEEAENLDNPLFERLRFLSIVANNLDEFYMVRVGSLHDQLLLENPEIDNKTGMTVKEQLDAVYARTQKHNKDRDKVFDKLSKDLRERNIHFLRSEHLSATEKDFMKQYFDQEILPLLSPQIVDPKHPFPFLQSKQTYVIVLLNQKGRKSLGILPINRQFLKPVVMLPGKKAVKFMMLEELVLMYAQRVFRDMEIEGRVILRIIRNADLDAEEAYYDEDNDYREFMKSLIKKRLILKPVKADFSDEAPKALKSILRKRLRLTAKQMFVLKSPLNFDFMPVLEEKLRATKRDDFFYPPLVPQMTPYADSSWMMKQLLDHDMFISYPYQSTTPVLKLLQEAAMDKKVVAIKIALYRVATESKIIAALSEAAENGKDVVVALELKARFDEENNINWSDKLEEAGCKVIYGVENYKVHSKIMVILRKDGNTTQTFTHVSSGNYNEKTARLYTDVNLLTSDKEIGEDALTFFNNLQLARISQETDYKHLVASPMGIKHKFLRLIGDEIANHFAKGNGHIVFKMNSFTDKDVLDALVDASQAGVKVDLMVRGLCCMIPGIKDVSENIIVHSIVGRFLEHSRIYYFHADGEEKIYIASADMMTRNTEKRVELACPIYDPKIKDELKAILAICLSDNVKAREMLEDGSYRHVKHQAPLINSQLSLYQRAYDQAEAEFPDAIRELPIDIEELKKKAFGFENN